MMNFKTTFSENKDFEVQYSDVKKVEIPGGGGITEQIQTDWLEEDTNSPAFLKNKPFQKVIEKLKRNYTELVSRVDDNMAHIPQLSNSLLDAYARFNNYRFGLEKGKTYWTTVSVYKKDEPDSLKEIDSFYCIAVSMGIPEPEPDENINCEIIALVNGDNIPIILDGAAAAVAPVGDIDFNNMQFSSNKNSSINWVPKYKKEGYEVSVKVYGLPQLIDTEKNSYSDTTLQADMSEGNVNSINYIKNKLVYEHIVEQDFISSDDEIEGTSCFYGDPLRISFGSRLGLDQIEGDTCFVSGFLKNGESFKVELPIIKEEVEGEYGSSVVCGLSSNDLNNQTEGFPQFFVADGIVPTTSNPFLINGYSIIGDLEDRPITIHGLPKHRVVKRKKLPKHLVETTDEFDLSSSEPINALAVARGCTSLFSINDRDNKYNQNTNDLFFRFIDENNVRYLDIYGIGRKTQLPYGGTITSNIETINDYVRTLRGTDAGSVYHSIKSAFSNSNYIDFSTLSDTSTKVPITKVVKKYIDDQVTTITSGLESIKAGLQDIINAQNALIGGDE